MFKTALATGLAATFLGLLIAPQALAANASDEVKDVREAFLKEAMEAQEAYHKELRRHARIAVSKLEKTAASAVRDGDLAGATAAMKQVLWLDRDNKKAVAHFKAIGRLEEVLEELEEEPVVPDAVESTGDAGNVARQLIGSTWSWGDGNNITFLPGGIASATQDKQPNSRLWQVDARGNVFVATAKPNILSIIKVDLSSGNYAGQNYKINNTEFSGRRVR
ncbi:hypothetical protein [Aeoliella mucimassa]|uniref:Tetratricopeptide repeat protein n=1 Tax=Aeoliella mucimassa TaxID=2527972 RepID=A0A518AUU4_9BACT|nr:hypothetical protein [Aeoliella mucimassa]QDU58482.1 hypothetical protein Pan181_47190 [Aeoliella mucimassa]